MVDFVVENWVAILAALTALVTVAERLARLTPTETDDRIVAAVGRVLRVLAVDVDPSKPPRAPRR